MESDIKVNQN